jgi:hypothetical protein
MDQSRRESMKSHGKVVVACQLQRSVRSLTICTLSLRSQDLTNWKAPNQPVTALRRKEGMSYEKDAATRWKLRRIESRGSPDKWMYVKAEHSGLRTIIAVVDANVY